MKNVIKYIVVSLIVTVMIVASLTNIEALNYTWSWGGNRASWTYSDSGYIYPSHDINLQAGDSLRYNGVTVTSGTGGGGSGDVVASGNNTLTGRNTFTGNNTFSNGNTFSDSLRADGYTIVDDAKITTNLRVTGDVITDLNFLKGSSTSIGTISTDSLAIITNNTKRIIINKDGYINILDSTKLGYYVFADSLYTKNITPNDGFGLVWTNPSSIKSVSGALTYNSSSHNINTQYGTFLMTIDSLNGLQLSKDIDTAFMDSKVYKTNNLDTTRFLDQSDTSSFARLAAFISETFNSYVLFNATVTFTVSPVFSALVNFANGITVTGTATFNGDMVNTGWKKIGSSKTQYQYTRDTVIWAVCATGPTTITTTHGLGNIGRLISYTCVIKDDSSGLLVSPGVSTGLVAVGLTPQAPTFDATNIYFRITGPMVNLDDNTDTIKYFIKYSDFQR